MNKVRDGYKITEIGEIPIEWECSKLEDYIEIRSGNSPSGFKLKEKGKYPFFKVDDMNYTSKYMKIAKVYFDECKYELMSKGMVVFPKRGASIFTNKVAILDRSGYFDTNTMGLTCSSKLNNEYLFYQLKFIGLEKFADTTAVPQINNKHINPLVIPIPTMEEQEKITSILSTVDEQIDNVDALIEKNKELKKGLMQTLLTKGIGHTKFKKTEIGEIPEEWEVSNLTNIVDIKGRVGWKGYTKKDLVEFGPLAIGAMHINSNNKLDLSEPVYLSKEKYEESPEIMVSKGDIILAQRGSLGKVVLIEKEIGEATINPSMVLIKNIKINSRYLYYFLCSEYIQKVIFKETSQTSIPMISQEQIGKFKIIIPTIKEQEKIASILSEVDKKIEEYENKKQKLEKLKKGLMQQLLTGKIRAI